MRNRGIKLIKALNRREAKKGSGDNVPSQGLGDEIPNVTQTRSASKQESQRNRRQEIARNGSMP